MRKKEVICCVCDKKFISVIEHLAYNHKNVRKISISPKGVYFEDSRKWFCQDCWKEIIKFYLKKHGRG